MRLGMFVSNIEHEQATYTSTRLAYAAASQGHEVFYIDAGGFVYGPGENLSVVTQRAPAAGRADYEHFVRHVKEAPREATRIETLDILMLRNDPAEDAAERPWAIDVGIVFGNAAQERGVMVVNDPAGLAKAANKVYLQEFPVHTHPQTLIARDANAVKSFADEVGGRLVLKPLVGAKGEKVFFLSGPHDPNLKQIIETIADDGYIVAQEFLEEARDGDVRIFMLDGEPLQDNGSWAAFRRRPVGDDLRSNMGSGGTAEAYDIGDTELELARALGPQLRQDGMFLVGLDIVGDKVVEINVQTPGGLVSIEEFTGVNFAPVVIEALEKRLDEAGR